MDAIMTLRVERAEVHAKVLIQQIRLMDERRYILQPLLDDEDVRVSLAEKFKDSYGAHAYNHLVPLLGQDLVRELSRLYLDKDRRSGSFWNLYRKASEPNLHAALRDKFRRIPDRWQEDTRVIPGLTEEETEKLYAGWRDQDRDEFGKSFDEGWSIAARGFLALEDDAIAEKIKTFRDKNHAHLELAPVGEEPGPFDVSNLGLTYSDLFEFADRYAPAAFELVRVLTGQVHDVTEFADMHRTNGYDLWRILAGLSSNGE